jgi:hypothetical protein
MHLEEGPDGSYLPVRIDSKALSQMKRDEIFVRHWPTAVTPYRYYKSIIPDLPITLCKTCQHFFHEEVTRMHAYTVIYRHCH